MRRLTATFVSFLSFALCGAATAQDFSGTYAAAGGAGPAITLVLRQNAQGQVTGTLSGNTQFQVQAQAQGGQLMGYAVAADHPELERVSDRDGGGEGILAV